MNTVNIKKSIASNIAYYRKANKMTQSELAARLSVKPTTVSTWERGASLPDAEILFSICVLFEVSLSAIYGVDPVAGVPVYLDDSESSLVSAYRSAPEEIRVGVRKLLDIRKKTNAESSTSA